MVSNAGVHCISIAFDRNEDRRHASSSQSCENTSFQAYLEFYFALFALEFYCKRRLKFVTNLQNPSNLEFYITYACFYVEGLGWIFTKRDDIIFHRERIIIT